MHCKLLLKGIGVGFVRADEVPGAVQAHATGGDHSKVCSPGAAVNPPQLRVATPDRMGSAVGVSEWNADPTWTSDGLPSGFPALQLLGGRTYSSFSGNDANQGMLTVGPFSIENRGCFILPVAHGRPPRRSVVGLHRSARRGCRLPESGKIVQPIFPWYGAGTNWRYWAIEVQPPVKMVRIVAEDRGSGWGQWLAVGEPHWCRAAAAIRPIRLAPVVPRPALPAAGGPETARIRDYGGCAQWFWNAR